MDSQSELPTSHRPRVSSRITRNRAQRLPAIPPRRMTSQELEDLRARLKEQFGGKEPRDFQVELVQAQEERRDSICQAATGMGKTAIAAGPYALPKNEGRVTFMISPLIGLQNEMVGPLSSSRCSIINLTSDIAQAETFREEYGLSAVAVNSAHSGCTRELMRVGHQSETSSMFHLTLSFPRKSSRANTRLS